MLPWEARRSTSPDTIMPYFIINKMPPGVKGLMLAGIFAAAMSTISSSINSISSSTAMDLLMISRRDIPEKRKISCHASYLSCGRCVMMRIACFLRDTKSPLVELGLSIASITYGGMLGIFIQGALFEQFSDRAALAGVVASIVAVLVISAVFKVFWPWFVPIGFTVSFVTGIGAEHGPEEIARDRLFLGQVFDDLEGGVPAGVGRSSKSVSKVMMYLGADVFLMMK